MKRFCTRLTESWKIAAAQMRLEQDAFHTDGARAHYRNRRRHVNGHGHSLASLSVFDRSMAVFWRRRSLCRTMAVAPGR